MARCPLNALIFGKNQRSCERAQSQIRYQCSVSRFGTKVPQRLDFGSRFWYLSLTISIAVCVRSRQNLGLAVNLHCQFPRRTQNQRRNPTRPLPSRPALVVRSRHHPRNRSVCSKSDPKSTFSCLGRRQNGTISGLIQCVASTSSRT